VVAVHRPTHDDWSLPKGKLDRGESWESAAIREVLEETAIEATVVRMLQPSAYLVSGRPKIVVWFSMDVVGRGEFVPTDEVNEIRWVWESELADTFTNPADVKVALEALQYD